MKNKLEIENFSGRSVLAIEQDFYITMYMTNIAVAAYWEAQEQVTSERAKKDNWYHYQVNVNHEIGVLKDRFILALLEDDAEKRSKQVRKILLLLAKRVSPVRPIVLLHAKVPPEILNFIIIKSLIVDGCSLTC